MDLTQQEKAREEKTSGVVAPGIPVEEPSAEEGSVPRLGKYLLEASFITAAQLEAALVVQRNAAAAGRSKRLGEILVEQRFITAEQLDRAVREQYQDFNSQFHD